MYGLAEVLVMLMRCEEIECLMLADLVNRMSLKGIRRLEGHLKKIMDGDVSVLYFNTLPTYKPPMDFERCWVIYKEKGRYVMSQV